MKLEFYLAHPFEMRKEIREWELEIEKLLEITLINPFYDGEGREDIQKIDKGLIIPRTIKSKEGGLDIVNKDLRLIEKAKDGIVAFIEKNKMSVGTPMELFYNSRILQKSTYVITNDLPGHPWIVGLATKVFEDRDKFVKFLYKQYYEKNINRPILGINGSVWTQNSIGIYKKNIK